MEFLKLNNLEFFYEEFGEGIPILIIHGFGLDHISVQSEFEPIFKSVAGYRRIYPDLPGSGKTLAPSWLNNADQLLNLILDFIENLIPNKNFLLAGESYGGYLIRGILYKMFERVKGIAFIVPVIHPDQKMRNLPNFSVIEQDPTILATLVNEDAQNYSLSCTIQNWETWTRFKKEILIPNKNCNQHFLSIFQEQGYAFSFDVDKIMGLFPRPTLFLTGIYDSIAGFKDGLTLLEKFPHSSYLILDRASHNLSIEVPEIFEFHIKNWLKRCNNTSYLL
jgi:pimeloyl-ACP methyl ester carboxylesterase